MRINCIFLSCSYHFILSSELYTPSNTDESIVIPLIILTECENKLNLADTNCIISMNMTIQINFIMRSLSLSGNRFKGLCVKFI